MKKEEFELSVVIPAYNASTWLKQTIGYTVRAITKAGIRHFEIIIVDDGSSDDTSVVAQEIAKAQPKSNIKVLAHKNSGRFLTRKRGVEAARYTRILFVDVRTWIDEGALAFLLKQLGKHPERTIWNAHINVAKKGNIIARFGDAITQIGWRRYFANPRLTSFGIDDFDHYPKGTGLFTVPTSVVKEAIRWFESTTKDIKNSSDDTLLMRHIAENHRIWISPDYAGTYFARTTFLAFIKHTYHRGKFFVDGFLHRGTRFFWPLIVFLVMSPLLAVMAFLYPVLAYVVAGLWLSELVVALIIKISLRDSLSLFLLTPIYAPVYAMGIWAAFLPRIQSELSIDQLKRSILRLGRRGVKAIQLLVVILRHNPWAVLILVLALVMNFWYIFLHFSNTLYSGPGDHTAGLIWLYQHSPSTPWWNFTTSSGFPFGDNLWNPSYIFSQGEYILYWLLARLFRGGIAGYNAITILGVSLSYLAMYRVMTKITKVKKYVAALLAYATVFNPFMLSAIGVGHFSYVFAPLVAILIVYGLWQYYVLKEYKIRYLLLTSITLGLTWLIDPYFMLFCGLIFAGFLLGFYLHKSLESKKLLFSISSLRPLIIMGFIVVTLVLPVGIFAAINTSGLKAYTVNIRSDIKVDARLYSARIKDYLLPSNANPVMPDAVKEYKKSTFHGKDKTYTIYIGWTICVLLVLSFFLLRKYSYLYSRNDKIAATALLMAIIALFMFSLPPTYKIGQLTIYMPTYFLVQFITMWRVFARAYIFMLPLIVMYISICLSVLSKTAFPVSKRKLLTVIIIIICVFIPVDLLNRNPFDTRQYFTFGSSLPTFYETVKNDKTIRTLAEYPLREAPHYRGSLYFTAQLYHHKKDLNSINPGSDSMLLRESLMDLDNPQTIRSLNYLGIDAISVWNNYESQWAPKNGQELKQIGSSQYLSIFGDDKIKLYRLGEYGDTGRYLVVPNWDARMTNGEDLYNVLQPVPAKGTLGIVDLCTRIGKKDCDGSEPKFTVAATLLNKSNKIQGVSIKATNNSKAVHYQLVPMHPTQITLASNLSSRDKITVQFQGTEGYIFGYNATLEEQK